MRYKIAKSDFLSYLKGALCHYTTSGVRAFMPVRAKRRACRRVAFRLPADRSP